MGTGRCVALFALSMVSVSLEAQTPDQLPKPGAEHKRLETFMGKWTTEGDATASPYGPAGKFHATETFEWFPGGFFMVHRSEGRQGALEFKWMEVIGYDPAGKTHTSQTFDSFGNVGSWKGTWRSNTLTWMGESVVAGKALKERCIITVAEPATSFTVKCEYSTGGSQWLPNIDLRGTRAR